MDEEHRKFLHEWVMKKHKDDISVHCWSVYTEV